MPHPHQGLPATAKEIGAVLDLLRTLATELLKVGDDHAYLTTGRVLSGFLDGIEGSRTAPPSGDAAYNEYASGLQVGSSMLAGGSRHL